MPCPVHFSLGFFIWRGFKNKSNVVKFCVKSFLCYMLHIAKLMFKQSGVVSLILIHCRPDIMWNWI